MSDTEAEKKAFAAQYPSNGHKARKTTSPPGSATKKTDDKSEKESRTPTDKIISGTAVQRKKTMGRKITETFTSDDAQGVGTYILLEVILPSVKDMVVDAGKQALDKIFYGNQATSRRSSSRPNHVGYNNMYKSNQGTTTLSSGGGRTISQRARATHNWDEVILTDRGEAEDVLDSLGALIEQYDQASVADLYDFVGITGSFADEKWGWTDLRGASVSKIREGWLLNLPKCIELNP